MGGEVTIDQEKLPRHVAIIMDGNRRWAAKKGKGAFEGHKFVMENRVEELIEAAGKLGISYLTFWAWSSENWKRPGVEVKGIMKLFRLALEKKAQSFIERGARLRVIGDVSKFPEDIAEGIRRVEEVSKKNGKITVTFALNYGGRDELLRAINKWLADKLNIKHKTLNISKKDLEPFLDTAGIPEPDLIIRPGGTKRLSGFMLWQSEYSELYFTDVLMPDFDAGELEKALKDFAKRDRRFGGGDFGGYSK